MSIDPAASDQVVAIGFNPFTPLGDAVEGTASDFLNAIGSSFCGMAADVSSSVFAFAAQKTAFDLNADYLVENYNLVFGVSVLVMTALFLCSAILGALRGDPHIVTRSIAATGTAILGSFVALGLLQLVLDASDGLADAFGNGDQLGSELVTMLEQLPDRGNFALSMMMSMMVATFSFLLFIVLFVRKIAIIAIVVFVPLYLAGQGAAVTQNWMRRAAEMLAALIFLKPVIYAIFTLGAQVALEATGSAADQTLALLTSVALMIASILAPFALFRLIGFADVQLTRNVGGAGRRAAASFGQGAGALLGSTSRDTFKGIGARLQTRNRGGLGVDASGGALAGGLAGGLTTGGRPSTRPGRGTAPRTPAPTGTSPARAGSAQAHVSQGTAGSSTAGVAARAGRNGTAVGQRVRVSANGPRATAASARPVTTRAAAPSSAISAAKAAPTPALPARPARSPAKPGRGGG